MKHFSNFSKKKRVKCQRRWNEKTYYSFCLRSQNFCCISISLVRIKDTTFLNSWEFRLIHVKDKKKKKAGKKKITSCSYVGIRAFLEKVLQSCNHGNHLAQSSVHYLQNTHTTFQVHLDPDKVNFTTEESFFFRPIPRAETGTAWREWVK